MQDQSRESVKYTVQTIDAKITNLYWVNAIDHILKHTILTLLWQSRSGLRATRW
jgi:hypothetical protein